MQSHPFHSHLSEEHEVATNGQECVSIGWSLSSQDLHTSHLDAPLASGAAGNHCRHRPCRGGALSRVVWKGCPRAGLSSCDSSSSQNAPAGQRPAMDVLETRGQGHAHQGRAWLREEASKGRGVRGLAGVWRKAGEKPLPQTQGQEDRAQGAASHRPGSGLNPHALRGGARPSPGLEAWSLGLVGRPSWEEGTLRLDGASQAASHPWRIPVCPRLKGQGRPAPWR